MNNSPHVQILRISPRISRAHPNVLNFYAHKCCIGTDHHSILSKGLRVNNKRSFAYNIYQDCPIYTNSLHIDEHCGWNPWQLTERSTHQNWWFNFRILMILCQKLKELSFLPRGAYHHIHLLWVVLWAQTVVLNQIHEVYSYHQDH